MNVQGKIEDQHFILSKQLVSVRYNDLNQLLSAVMNEKESFGCFVVTTDNITDSINSWKEEQLKRKAEETANTDNISV